MRRFNSILVKSTLDARASEQNGFTLIELMVTLTVLAILLGLAAPSFARLIAANRLTTQTNELVASLNFARSEAVRRVQPVTLLGATSSNSLSGGWRVNDSGSTTLKQVGALGGTTTITSVACSSTPSPYTCAPVSTSTAVSVTFTSRGAITAPVFFKVCDSGSPTVSGRIVQVSFVGTVSLPVTSASCP